MDNKLKITPIKKKHDRKDVHNRYIDIAIAYSHNPIKKVMEDFKLKSATTIYVAIDYVNNYLKKEEK